MNDEPNRIPMGDSHSHLDRRNYPQLGRAIDELGAALVSASCDRAVVLQLPLDLQFERTDEWVRVVLSAGNLMPFVYVSPDPQIELDYEIPRQLDAGAIGLKFHPRLEGLPLSHPVYEAAASLANRYGAPIVIDGFIDWTLMRHGDFLTDFGHLAERNPQAQFCLAHCGSPRLLESLMLAKRLANVFLDTSFTLEYFRHSSLVQDMTQILWSMNGQRVMFGSDYPEVSIADSAERLMAITSHGQLSADVIARIFSGTLHSFVSRREG